ncbi:hypothetical protein L3Q82_015951, partial [Scortum barcoo]
MRSLGWIILLSSLTALRSAQVSKVKTGCPPPPEYPNTRLDQRSAGKKKFGDGEKVYYDCDEDFTPTRGSRAVQCVDGRWTKMTLKCEKRTCGNVGELPNGEFHYEGNSFVGERVYAVCDVGYTLKGLNYMICKKTGWTGEFPSCEEGETTCSRPAVANSVSSPGDVPLHRVGDSVNFTCSQGFQLDGAPEIICGPDSQWHPQPPQCLPSPDKTTGGCDVPLTERNSNANLANRYITKPSFASGDKVQYTCDVGYVSVGGSRYRRCINGKWTRLTLRCERKTCGSAGEITNGHFTYTGVEFGDTATAVCKEGYQLVGQPTRRCLSQGWDGRVPVCEAAVCEEPADVANAEIKGHQDTPYTYMSVVRYHCSVGILTGEKEIWCTEDGTWSAPPPTCNEVTCPSPNVPRAFRSYGHKQQFQYREVVLFQCHRGYELTGPDTVTCGQDGQWLPKLPECI